MGHVAEGDARPGYDVPMIYRVSFSVGRETYARDIEVPDASRRSWAVSRAIASVANELRIKKEKMSLFIGKVRSDRSSR